MSDATSVGTSAAPTEQLDLPSILPAHCSQADPADTPAIIATLDDETKAILAVALQDFFARTCIEIGAMLKQLGRRAIEIQPSEIQKLSRTYDVHVTKTPTGALRYEMTVKGKPPSWAKAERG